MQRFKQHTLALLIITNLALVGITIGVWIVFSEILQFNALTTLIGTLAFMAGLGLLMATALERIITKPFQLLHDTVHFMHTDKQQAAPDISELMMGRTIVTETITRLYELAANIKTITQDLHDENDTMQHMLNELPASVLVLNREQKIVYANEMGKQSLENPSAEDFADLPLQKLTNLRFEDEFTFSAWLADCRENKIKDTHFWSRVTNTLKDGSVVYYDMSAHYTKDDPGGNEATIVITDRTTDYSADENKMDFVALAAHELRSPITVIRGYLDVFKNEFGDSFTPEKRRLVNRMTVASAQLSSYVNNILNVAKYEQGTMKIHQVNADWPAVIEIALRPLRMRAKAHGRSIELKVSGTIPSVAVDRSAITQVITNLVDNAIKYSDERGVITIKVKMDGDDMVETQVIDTGIGIPESVVSNVFKKFYRSHRSKTHISGTGLGLFLARVIIESHGGTIWVRSKENEGSTFGFTVPTYHSVEDELKGGGSTIEHRSEGWIKNHSMVRK